MKTQTFTLKKIALAMMIAAGTLTGAHAALTGSTGTVQGQVPTLKATSNSVDHAVSFAASDPAGIKTGDTVTMTYKYTDTDGDADDSTTTVQWYYVPSNGTGTPVAIPNPTNSLAAGTDGTGTGSSAIVIPDAAVGSRIKAVITEKSVTGDPREGFTITYNDVSKVGAYEGGPGGTPSTPTAPTNPDVPDLPVAPGSGLVTKILEVGGDGTTNLIGSPTTTLQVGKTYQFKLYASDGVTDLTDTVNYKWKLTGTSATTGTAAPATLFNPDANFSVPTNTAGKVISGSDDGVQGYGLQVDYIPKP